MATLIARLPLRALVQPHWLSPPSPFPGSHHQCLTLVSHPGVSSTSHPRTMLHFDGGHVRRAGSPLFEWQLWSAHCRRMFAPSLISHSFCLFLKKKKNLTFDLAGQCLYSAWQHSKWHDFPMSPHTPTGSLRCDGQGHIVFFYAFFLCSSPSFSFHFFSFYNEGVIALLCSSLPNHQTAGKTKGCFSSWDSYEKKKCFSLVWCGGRRARVGKTAEWRQECADSLSLYLYDDASVQNLKCHWWLL